MKPKVDKEKCTGCATCVGLCPDVFELNSDGKAVVKADADFEASKEKIGQAIESCPSVAITAE